MIIVYTNRIRPLPTVTRFHLTENCFHFTVSQIFSRVISHFWWPEERDLWTSGLHRTRAYDPIALSVWPSCQWDKCINSYWDYFWSNEMFNDTFWHLTRFQMTAKIQFFFYISSWHVVIVCYILVSFVIFFSNFLSSIWLFYIIMIFPYYEFC